MESITLFIAPRVVFATIIHDVSSDFIISFVYTGSKSSVKGQNIPPAPSIKIYSYSE